MGVSSWVSVEATTDALPPPTPTGTVCFDMVRGSAVRVTGLGNRGQVPDPAPYAVSKSVVKVVIGDVVEAGSTEIMGNPEEERRLRFVRSAQTIRHRVDIEFLRVDPGVYSLVAGVPTVLNDAGDVVGFDSNTHLPPASFALEVWSKLAARYCVDGSREWGYTLFPYLKGGRIGGFRFHSGLVSFNLIGAQTRRASRWGVGPHDMTGPFERLLTPVSRNTSYRIFTTPTQPPAETCGVQTTTDVLDNGTAANPMPIPSAPLVVDGGGAAETSAFIIDGGRA